MGFRWFSKIPISGNLSPYIYNLFCLVVGEIPTKSISKSWLAPFHENARTNYRFKELEMSQMPFSNGMTSITCPSSETKTSNAALPRRGWERTGRWKRSPLPSLKLTARGLCKRKLNFQPQCFRCYVSFREGKFKFDPEEFQTGFCWMSVSLNQKKGITLDIIMLSSCLGDCEWSRRICDLMWHILNRVALDYHKVPTSMLLERKWSIKNILLMEEIPNNHLGCIKPCKSWGYLNTISDINWLAGCLLPTVCFGLIWVASSSTSQAKPSLATGMGDAATTTNDQQPTHQPTNQQPKNQEQPTTNQPTTKNNNHHIPKKLFQVLDLLLFFDDPISLQPNLPSEKKKKQKKRSKVPNNSGKVVSSNGSP